MHNNDREPEAGNTPSSFSHVQLPSPTDFVWLFHDLSIDGVMATVTTTSTLNIRIHRSTGQLRPASFSHGTQDGRPASSSQETPASPDQVRLSATPRKSFRENHFGACPFDENWTPATEYQSLTGFEIAEQYVQRNLLTLHILINILHSILNATGIKHADEKCEMRCFVVICGYSPGIYSSWCASQYLCYNRLMIFL
jgi:hypothetical protein